MKTHDSTVSPAWGFHAALRLWRIVLAVWIVPLLLAIPGWLIARGFLGRLLGAVPFTSAAHADLPLILMQGLHRAGPALSAWVVTAMLALWAWAVAWRAGVATWHAWGTGRPVRLGEILGYGVLRWWRYVRLSLTALAGLIVLGAAVTVPLFLAARSARQHLAETRMVNFQLAAIGLALLVVWICWSATLRGAWELARPERRSAAIAWFRGLTGTFRQPIRSFGTVLLWGVAGKTLTVAPFLFKLHVPAMRGTPGGVAATLILTLLAAFCWVALYLSFAPVSGLIPQAEEEEAPAATEPPSTEKAAA
ncbi:MAG: hypothetical protein GXP48_11995 [Acidobacteria bacterium]|nr:hypothetical protein [Acidobacteriota bacterium]